ncbi:MAG: APC family permease [Sporocytophaga sp.]|nr:APC family permease [Sporocytophaga sp.]
MANSKKIGFNATWSMSVGGMVGGGIFSVLGLIVQSAGQWAWFSFFISGIIGFIAAYSYCQLSIKYKEGGGAFTYLREINRKGFAGGLAWVLIFGYILSLSVYAFTFGHYVAHALSKGPLFTKTLSLGIVAILTLINLRGAKDSSGVEVLIVWGKVIALVGIAVIGLFHWNTEMLTKGIEPKGIGDSLVGAATIFIAYQGFQLITYDYKDIENPEKTLPSATLSSVLFVILLYILVALGTTMLVGADIMIKDKEVALSVAGKAALGQFGYVVMTIAAAFSTASAINATLFSTSRLIESIAKKNDLPESFTKENQNKIPYIGLITIGILSAALAMLGSLSDLVSATSLIFLFTFGVVCYVAFHDKVRFHWICLLGTIGCVIAMIVNIISLSKKSPIALVCLAVLVLLAVFGRRFILKGMKRK